MKQRKLFMEQIKYNFLLIIVNAYKFLYLLFICIYNSVYISFSFLLNNNIYYYIIIFSFFLFDKQKALK
jgi:hypothetical protein